MHFVSAVIFALSANMDNLAIGLAYGIKGVRVRLCSNLLVALITCLGTLASMCAGAALTNMIPQQAASNLGCVLLIAMGLWFIVSSLRKKRKETIAREIEEFDQPVTSAMDFPPPESATSVSAGPFHPAAAHAAHGTGPSYAGAVALTAPWENAVSLRETFLLAFALTANNIGFGVGARIAGLPIAATAGSTFLFSMLLLRAGVLLGERFRNTFLSQYTDLISGCMVIALGIYEFFV